MKHLLFIILSTILLLNNNLYLEIVIPNIKQDGIIYIAIYDNADDYSSGDESQDIMAYNIIEPVFKGVYSKKIYLKKGVYAIKVLVDNNDNGKMDLNFFGIPKEQFGFSNNVLGILGVPKFEKASFKLNSNKKIEIKLR
ncbi:MAG: DUF2141 domain-containing protein [Bacteroidota bacterium]|nr:DUF2141 domain-containing protein [Bacteroidota bacterium]MEC7876738.1 DUF2141 domain-containing protein [Bacteroidota bacterium]MEC8602682.1 DUF2141 domain-containing protein [Bacteroidota bacterium]